MVEHHKLADRTFAGAPDGLAPVRPAVGTGGLVMSDYVLSVVAGEEIGLLVRSTVLQAPGVGQDLGMGFAYDSGSADGGLAALAVGIARTPSLVLFVYMLLVVVLPRGNCANDLARLQAFDFDIVCRLGDDLQSRITWRWR